MITTKENILYIISNPAWYQYDFSIPLRYLDYISSTDENYKNIGERLTILRDAELPPQSIIQDIMSMVESYEE